jgi:hypothetical protein
MRAMKGFALLVGLWLLFNLVALPMWWGGVNAQEGPLALVQWVVLLGFVLIFIFDVVSALWLMTRLCWIRSGDKGRECERGWLLVLAFLAMVGLSGAKVMVDEIARETSLGRAQGEWVVLYVCLSIQLAYILAVFFQRSSGEETTS